MIARKLIFLENIGILIFFRMIPIQFKYLDSIIKKKNKILRKSKIRNKTKTHRPNQKMDFRPAITQKKIKKMRPDRLKSTE